MTKRTRREPGDGPSIDLHHLELHADRPVYGPLDLRVEAGEMLVITGPAGSGKTSLLLTLTGRMKASGGTGTILGLDARTELKAIRHASSLAWVDGITDLDKDFTVEQHIAERLIMLQPWYKPVAARHQVREVLHSVDFSTEMPANAYTSDLTQRQKFELEIVLARLDRTPLLAVDNLDLLRERADREHAWELLRDVRRDVAAWHPEAPLTVIVTCEDDSELHDLADLPDGIVTVRLGARRVPLG